MKTLFGFGEKVPGVEVRVVNEREVRAAAGIMFLGAFIAFMNAWLLGNFNYIKLFVIIFLSDFTIRLFISPQFSPAMILGRIFVRNQTVEYAGAPQKKFAWLLGWALAVTMFFLVVTFDVRGPLNLSICLICLTLLFFEAAFGICIGCKLYNLFNKEKAKLCPGGACAIKRKEPIQKVRDTHIAILILFILLMGVIATTIVFA